MVLSKVRQAVGREVLAGRRELTLSLPADAEVDVEQALAAAARARVAIGGDDPATAWEAASATVAIAGSPVPAGTRRPVGARAPTELEDLRLRALELQAQAGVALGGATSTAPSGRQRSWCARRRCAKPGTGC